MYVLSSSFLVLRCAPRSANEEPRTKHQEQEGELMTHDTMQRLEHRLAEAFDELWAGFVDPRDAYFDDAEGAAWMGVGKLGGAAAAHRSGVADEQELAAV